MKRKKFSTNKCSSFEELERHSLEFDLSLTPAQRLDSAQFLREQYYLIRNIEHKPLDKKITKAGFSKN